MPENHFLNHIFKATNFSKEELDAIIPKFKKISFAKNDYLLKEGKTENQYWFIESGFVRSYVVDTEGNYLGITDTSLSRIRKEISEE